VTGAAIGAVLMVVMDSLAQGIEMAKGDRTKFDASSLVTDLAMARSPAPPPPVIGLGEVFLPR